MDGFLSHSSERTTFGPSTCRCHSLLRILYRPWSGDWRVSMVCVCLTTHYVSMKWIKLQKKILFCTLQYIIYCYSIWHATFLATAKIIKKKSIQPINQLIQHHGCLAELLQISYILRMSGGNSSLAQSRAVGIGSGLQQDDFVWNHSVVDLLRCLEPLTCCIIHHLLSFSCTWLLFCK